MNPEEDRSMIMIDVSKEKNHRFEPFKLVFDRVDFKLIKNEHFHENYDILV